MRPGRAVLWRKVHAGVAPWQISLARLGFLDLFLRLWPRPWLSLRLQARRVCLVLSTTHGYVMDRDGGTVWLWGGE